ncbi:MAG: TonB family protein [Betaproteobacteria bacterium]
MTLLVIALAATLAAGAGEPPSGDRLSAAKELYAAAAYEDALAMLTRLSADGAAGDSPLQIDEYRSLCLYALGRTAEAESAVRDILQRNPLFDPGQDLSPRVESMFTDVRKQLLPGLAREKYRAARAAMDAKEFAAAESDLTDVRRIISEADRLGIKDDAMADLAVLAEGFRDLVQATLAKQAAAAAAARAPAPAPAAASPTEAPRQPATPAIYDASDADVVPPVPIVQTLPPVPPALVQALRSGQGILVVTIAPDGHVTEAIIRRSLNAAYDEMVAAAARLWRYKPAMKDGVPVPYVKAITLTFSESQ